jgi:uncharacterized protein YcfJ
MRRALVTTLAALATAGAAVAAVPVASADSTPDQAAPVAAAPAKDGFAQARQSCNDLGASQTQFQSAGNVQIHDAPPQVNYFPLGDS